MEWFAVADADHVSRGAGVGAEGGPVEPTPTVTSFSATMVVGMTSSQQIDDTKF